MLYMNITAEQSRIQKQIQSLQRELAQLGPLRPGCLSRQYRNPKTKAGPYYQLSYTYRMKSKTEYIPADCVPQIQQEVATYKRYRELNHAWIQLSIEGSRLKIKQGKETTARNRQSA